MDGFSTQKCGLPGELSGMFSDVLVIREAALALDKYMLDANRDAAVAALGKCGLPHSRVLRVLEIVDAGAGGRDE